MSYNSNAAEEWYPESAATSQEEIHIDLLPPASLNQPLRTRLLGSLRDTLAPEKLPPLQLSARPLDLGVPLGERLRMPWFRTVFTNIGDVVSPEVLPPLELESVPVTWMLLPPWSEVISTRKVFYPDKPSTPTPSVTIPRPATALPATAPYVPARPPVEAGLLRDLRRSRVRGFVWMGVAAVQVIYLVVSIIHQ
jgi:hypothetical protein